MRWAAHVFVLLLGLGFPSHAADVRFVQMAKTVSYLQAGPGAPVIQSPNAYQFRVRVDLAREESIAAVTFKGPLPSGSVRALTNLVAYWEFSQRFPGSEALNLTFPNGTYSISLQGSIDGKRTNVLTLSADGYPNPVHIANFTAAQSVNAKSDFTLQWDPPGTGQNDFVQVRLFSGDQVVFETGSVPGAAGTLSGSATSVIIPKNTLSDGAVFRAQVIASRRSTTDAIGHPGVPAWAFYSRSTGFTLRTIYPTLDVTWFGVTKLRRFSQNSVLTPTPITAGGYSFSVFTFATDALNVKSASLKLPNGSSKTMSAAGSRWGANDSFNTQQALDTAYAAGNYELNLQTAHNGTQKLSLPLAASVYPPALQISNWNDASSIDATRTFNLKWTPLPAGSTDDYVQVIVRKAGEVIFRTGDYPGAPGALDGRVLTATLPAGLLQPGEAAEVTMTFLRPTTLERFAYPQALGTCAFGCETRAVIRAAGGDVPRPVIGNAAFINGAFEFTVSAVPGRLYKFQTLGGFGTWSDAFSTNAPGESFIMRFAASSSRAIFRAQVY